MAVWRCPHCATPQPESSRCWVCRRSTTSCASCRHFRKAVAGGLGICGLDPRRSALTGNEMRPCWAAATPPPEPEVRVTWAVGPGAPGAADRSGTRGARTFVPVESVAAAVAVLEAVEATAALEATPVQRAAEPAPSRPVPGRWWLWGDPEPWPET